MIEGLNTDIEFVDSEREVFQVFALLATADRAG